VDLSAVLYAAVQPGGVTANQPAAGCRIGLGLWLVISLWLVTPPESLSPASASCWDANWLEATGGVQVPGTLSPRYLVATWSQALMICVAFIGPMANADCCA
jgi:hypothetical protein